MGIFDSIGNIVRGQLIDVIEWTDTLQSCLAHLSLVLLVERPDVDAHLSQCTGRIFRSLL